MGKISHASPGQFANELGDYLRFLVDANGRTGAAGRWLEKVTDGARKREYWLALVKGEREMTSNDVDVVAKTFGIPDPFTYVRNAHTLATTKNAPVFNVGTHDEDYDISEDPGDYTLAAKQEPSPGQ